MTTLGGLGALLRIGFRIGLVGLILAFAAGRAAASAAGQARRHHRLPRARSPFRFIRYQWRFAIFALLAIAGVGAGVILIAVAVPVDVGFYSLPFQSPIDVYVSNPQASVSVTVDIDVFPEQTPKVPNENIYLKINPPKPGDYVSWLLVLDPSTHPTGLVGAFPKTVKMTLYSGFNFSTSPSFPETVVSGSTNDLLQPMTPPNDEGVRVAWATIDPPYQFAGGRFSAKLPQVISAPSFEPEPNLRLETAPDFKKKVLVSFGPPDFATGRPTFPEVIKGSLAQDFYVPSGASTTERLLLYSGQLDGYRIDTSFPPNVQSQGGELVWRGGNGLEASMIATNVEAEQYRSLESFLAGIAFASGIAAFIALLQERPRRDQSDDSQRR